jgi:hypothetical protein
MRSARSSVDEAAGRSPRATWARACVTSEPVAGESRFSRTAGGALGAGGNGKGWGEAWGTGWADGDDVGGPEATREVAQPAMSNAAQSATASLLSEWAS